MACVQTLVQYSQYGTYVILIEAKVHYDWYVRLLLVCDVVIVGSTHYGS